MIHGHGDEFTGELVANFSSNVWYGADHSRLHAHLASKLQTIARYPETNAASLQLLIASKNEMQPSQAIVTNGSAEAFYLIAHAFSDAVSVIVSPTFSEYADACRMHKHKVHLVSREKLTENIEVHKPDLVWICNPNNPDGHCFMADELKAMFAKYPSTCFVIDQAYVDFAASDGLFASETNQFSNLILVQSLTKRYAIPGLRLGYLVACESITQRISDCQIPWSVNSLAIEAGKFVLENDTFDFEIDKWLYSSNRLQIEIDTLEVFETVASKTPFFLVKLTKGKAEDLKRYLLSSKILVRQATNFEGLEGEYIRICGLSATENNLLLEKLKEWKRYISQ
jgi:threonine-phosphate decarboxylase